MFSALGCAGGYCNTDMGTSERAYSGSEVLELVLGASHRVVCAWITAYLEVNNRKVQPLHWPCHGGSASTVDPLLEIVLAPPVGVSPDTAILREAHESVYVAICQDSAYLGH